MSRRRRQSTRRRQDDTASLQVQSQRQHQVYQTLRDQATAVHLAVWPNNSQLLTCTKCYSSALTTLYNNDGYRQQNVRQRQKLISIIDYDVCMTFY